MITFFCTADPGMKIEKSIQHDKCLVISNVI